MYYAGADVLSDRCLDAVHAVVKMQPTKWMQDKLIAYSLTLLLNGWSNCQTESTYSWNVIFPRPK